MNYEHYYIGMLRSAVNDLCDAIEIECECGAVGDARLKRARELANVPCEDQQLWVASKLAKKQDGNA